MPTTPPDELSDVPHEWRDLASFTDLLHARCLVYVPRDQDDLRRIFAWAHSAHARLTFRAGGHSFDDQALGSDLEDDAPPHLVVSMTSFDRLDVDVQNARMTVGPGTTWGAILARLEPLGFVPYVTVTTEHATAGGTLSGDCLSRFSPAFGKEGRHIAEFSIMTVDGEEHVCTAPADGELPSTLGERLFCGAIGGLGFLGVVTSITHDLFYVGETNGKIGIESFVFKYDSFRALATDLVPLALRAESREVGAPDSIFSALYASNAKQSSLIIHSRFTSSPDRIPMPQHQPKLAIRVVVEWLMRVSFLNPILWSYFFWLLKEDKRYVDDLAGYTFMMDGNVRAKEIAEGLGFTQRAIQQTFIIPVHSDDTPREGADERLAAFLEAANARFEKAGVEATLLDVLYIPRDEHFLLSASTAMAGFAVSFAFETSSMKRIALVEECFVDLSETCLAAGGRVHLVKNVRAKSETLKKMYAATLPELFALKSEVDPGKIIHNAFFARHFPDAP